MSNEYDAIAKTTLGLSQGRPPETNEYDSILNDVNQQNVISLRSKLGGSSTVSPDSAAEAIKLAGKTGVPPSTVIRNLDEVKRKDQQSSNEYDMMIQQSPKLSSWLKEGENAALARDDLAKLGGVEWLVTAPIRAFRRGQAQVEFGNLRSESLFRELTDTEQKRLATLRASMNEGGDLGAESWFGSALTAGAQQLPMLFGGLLAGAKTGMPASIGAASAVALAGQLGPQAALPEEIATVPAAALTGYYIGQTAGAAQFGFKQEAGFAYEEYSKFKDNMGRPMDPDVARMAAIATGAINAGLEAFQINTLLRSIPGADKLAGAATRNAVQEALRSPTVRAALKELALGYGKTLTMETTTEVAQRAVTILSGELAKTVGNQKIERRGGMDIAKDLANEAIESAQAFTFISLPGPVMRAGGDAIRIREAKKNEAFFQALGENVAESKTFQRLPEKMQEFVSQATKDGPIENVYIPAQQWVTYWQGKGLDPANVAEQVTGDRSQYQEAIDTGTDIRVPTARYATLIAPTEHNQFFAQEVRLGPDEMNSREAKELETVLAQQAAPQQDNKQVGSEQIRTAIRDMLVSSGMEQQTAETNAALYHSVFNTIGERAGLDPVQLFERFGLKIARPDVQQQAQQGETKIDQGHLDFGDRRKLDTGGDQRVSPVDRRQNLAGRVDFSANQLLEAKGRERQLALTVSQNNTPDNRAAWKVARDEVGARELELKKARAALEFHRSTQFNQSATSFDRRDSVIDSPEFKAWFNNSDIVDAQGKPLVVYHGAQRLDRVGPTLKKNRATSGPMPFFTDDPAIASSYAAGKPDTSLGAEDQSYDSWFKVKIKGYRNAVDLPRAWYSLPQEERDRISRLAPQVTKDDDGNIIVEEGNTRGIGNYDWEIKQSRGNALKALIEGWLAGGVLFDDEEVFLEVLKKAGMTTPVEMHDPNATFSGVLPVFLSIQNPLRTNAIPDSVIAALEKGVARSRARPDLAFGDTWDKRRRDPKEWVAELKADREAGKNSHVWTSIPDVITKVLSSLGYDGIVDVGGKMGGEGHNVFIPFEPRQVKSAVGNVGTFDPLSGNILKQGGDENRGSIRFGADRQFNIDLLKNADLSTFAHESGHFWLEVLGDVVDDLSRRDPALLNEQQINMVADYQKLLDWFGVNNRGGIKVEHHEQFARGIEQYLGEGKAPSIELRSVFSRFRAWIIAVYRSLTALNVKLNDDVRGVMDRLMATDEQIAQAENEANVSPIFTTAEQAGMTEAEFNAYRKTVQAAADRGRDELHKRVMAEMQRERTKLWKDERARVLTEVEGELGYQRDNVALAVLQKGVMPNGEELPEGMEPIKLDRKGIIDLRGEEFLKALPRPYIYTRDGGIHPNMAAEMFGYKSGDELLTAMTQVKPYRAQVEAETDARMRARHGDLLLDGTLADAARLAVQNDERAKLIDIELRALAKRQRMVSPHLRVERNQRTQDQRAGVESLRAAIPSLPVIRAMAIGRIGQTTVRDIRPQQYSVAARRAAQQAIEAAAKDDFSAAVAAKQRELINVELFRAATEARENVDTIADYMRSFGDGKKRGRIAKAGEEYLDQIDGIIDRYEFVKVPLKTLDRRKSLAAFVAEQERKGQPVNIPDALIDETKSVNYKELQYDELVGVNDAVKNIEHIARFKNRLLKAQASRDLDEVVTSVSDSIRENAKKAKGRKIESRLPEGDAARMVDQWFASHRKLSSHVRQMDGWKDGGLMWEYIMRPINEAGERETEMNADVTRKLADIFSAAYPNREVNSLYQKGDVPSLGIALSKMGRLAIALNWGNEQNRQRIMAGYGWNESQIAAVLDTLDERDWKFVQSIWSLIDSYWSEIEAKEKRVNGVAPEKVEPSPVMTKFGEFKGGYYPLKYDDRQSAGSHGNRVKEAAELMMAGGYGQSTTRRGHTKARAEKVEQPVRLDFGVFFEHFTQVIHDLTHHEALIDVNKVLSNKKVSSAVIEVHGDVTYKHMQDAIFDIAAGDIPASGAFESFVNWTRSGTTIAGLGWNMMTSLMQPLGISQSIVRVGPEWIGKGFSRWFRDAASMDNTAAWIQEKSSMMRMRANTQMREINEIKNRAGLNTGRLAGWVDEALSKTTFDTLTRQGIVDSYFWLIYKGQQVADIPTWIGAYEKAMANDSTNEARAIALADQAVLDAQGGGQMKDLAAVQRGGPLLKIWTSFYSYFNVTWNLTVESVRKTKYNDPISIGRLAVDMLLLYTVPATLTELMKHALTGGDDDPDKLASKLIRSNLSYMMGVMLGLREIGSAIQGYAGYEGPAGARFFSSVAKLVKQGDQGEADGAFFRALNEVAGALFHYPAGQVRRTVEGYIALMEGTTSNPLALLFGAPKP